MSIRQETPESTESTAGCELGASPGSASSSFEHGLPYAYGGKMVCPKCSKFEGVPETCTWPARITIPVFLMVRVNKTLGQKFLGCPNFPKCKCSADVYSVRVAKRRARVLERVLNIDYDDELRPY